MIRSLILLLAPIAFIAVACSTGAHFRIPEKTKLLVGDRHVTPDQNGLWETSPFFWDQMGGARYFLYDENGKLVRRGKLKTTFRVVSVFWPPVALAYWPTGFEDDVTYDLTKTQDGYLVRDEPIPVTGASNASSSH